MSGAAALQPFTNPNGPLCANLSLPVKTALRAIPAPAADKLCPTLLNGPINTCESRALPAARDAALAAGTHGQEAARPRQVVYRF